MDLRNISLNIEQYEQLKTNVSDGEVLKIVCIKNKIFIITRYSIYKYDEELKIKMRESVVSHPY